MVGANNPKPVDDFLRSAIDKKIYSFAYSQGLPSPLCRLLVAQSRVETADYTSNVCKKYNNYFGYKYVGQKKWAIGKGGAANAFDAQGNKDGGNYASYAKLEDSVGEVCDWIKRRVNGGFDFMKVVNYTEYAEILKRCGYYGQTSKEYAASLGSKMNKINLV